MAGSQSFFVFQPPSRVNVWLTVDSAEPSELLWIFHLTAGELFLATKTFATEPFSIVAEGQTPTITTQGTNPEGTIDIVVEDLTAPFDAILSVDHTDPDMVTVGGHIVNPQTLETWSQEA